VSLNSTDFSTSETQGEMPLDGARIASSAILTGRAIGQRLYRTARNLTVQNRILPIASPVAVNILAVGDSLTHRKVTERLGNTLPALGVNPTWIGTLNGLTAAGANNGPLCEGREGWTTSDILGSYGAGSVVTNGVLPAGQETTYLASSYDTKSAYQVFLNPNINAGSQAPIVTIGGTQYRFDMRYYLTRFSLSDPDVVLLNLGMNDSIKLGGAVVTSANFPAILAEIRRALPNAKIICWGTVSAVSPDGDNLWITHAGTLDAICTAVRAARISDANLHLVSSWAHMSAEVGWPLSTSAATTDANGYVTTVVQDSVHPLTAERPAHLAVAVAVANLV
jgi:lysophospholipase L1-like esterase